MIKEFFNHSLFFFVLPNSGLLVKFPIDMGLNASRRANEEYHTVPNVKTNEPIEKTFDIIRQSNN